jgi:hypothetical protein
MKFDNYKMQLEMLDQAYKALAELRLNVPGFGGAEYVSFEDATAAICRKIKETEPLAEKQEMREFDEAEARMSGPDVSKWWY